jgi:acyl phosphate:glycerol-3-phosphate acyltransferase
MIVPALTLVLLIFGYLLGSLSSAIIVSRVMGLPDPRKQGSGNPGATNILRLAGKGPAAIVLLGDMMKGLVPLLVAGYFELPPMALAGIALAPFLGHLYPAFFDFQGGKGVATFFGVLLGLSWMVGALALLTWLAVALLFRLSSLAALSAALMAPLYMHWFHAPLPLLVVSIIMSTLLVLRHQINIQNLFKGAEPKISFAHKTEPETKQ